MADGIDTPGYPAPVPPRVQEQLDRVRAEIAAAEQGVTDAVRESVDALRGEVNASRADVYRTVNTTIGAMDATVRQLEVPITRAIERTVDGTIRDVVSAESNMRVEGARIPLSPDAIYAALADTSGQAIVDQLPPERVYMYACIARPQRVMPNDVPGPRAPSVQYNGAPGGWTGQTGWWPVSEDFAFWIAPAEIYCRNHAPPPGWVWDGQLYEWLHDGTFTLEPPPKDDTEPAPPIPPVEPDPFKPVPMPPVEPPQEPPPQPPVQTFPSPPPPPSLSCPAPVVPVTCPSPSINVPAPIVNITIPPPPPPSSPPSPPPPPPPPIVIPSPPPPPPPPGDVPPPPPPPPPPGVPDLPGIVRKPGSAIDPNDCRNIDRQVGLWTDGPFIDGASSAWVNDFGQLYRLTIGTLSAGLTRLTGGTTLDASSAMRSAYATTAGFLGGVSNLQTALDLYPQELLENRRALVNLMLEVGSLRKAAEATGAPTEMLELPLQYAINYMQAAQLPSQAELNHLAATGRLAHDLWECYSWCLGTDTVPQQLVMESQYAQYNIGEVIQLARRNKLTPEIHSILTQRAGVPSREQYMLWDELSNVYPTISDITRLMVRDAADDDVAAQYGYDKDFETKLYGKGGRLAPGIMHQWMRINGITEETMRYLWRAHWEIPSNTALYEMLHRLRPDRPEVREYAKAVKDFEEGHANKVEKGKPVIVTVDDVRHALEVNDVAPGFIEPLLAISYTPINRTDSINAYMASLIDDDALYHRLRDVGYNDRDAREIVRVQSLSKARRLSNVSGVWTTRQIISAYRRGTLTGAEAQKLLAPIIPDQSTRDGLLRGADLAAEEAVKSARLKKIRRGFFVGEYDVAGLVSQLNALTMDGRRVSDLVSQWTAERDGRYKEPSARQVIQWAVLGIITPLDAHARYMRMGYNHGDAERMVYQGLHGQVERIRSRVKEMQTEVKTLIKDAKQAERQEKADLEKRQKDIKAAQEKMQKEYDRIQKELESRLPT